MNIKEKYIQTIKSEFKKREIGIHKYNEREK